MAAAAVPRLLWYTSVDDVQCSDGQSLSQQPAEWDVYVSSLEAADRAKVQSFVFPDDQKRALVSIFMQRAAVRHHLQLNNDAAYVIHRTPENKPYALATSSSVGHWNYSVSHHGRYVCLAAHPWRLVGADVVDYLTRPAALRLGSVEQYLGMFEKYLDPREVAAVRAEPTEDSQFLLFFVTWALKEAYVKAVGLGLKYPLRNVCFTIVYSDAYKEAVKRSRLGRAGGAGTGDTSSPVWAALRGTATAVVGGEPRPDWWFEFVGLDRRHLLAVAEGPLEDATESYQRLAWGSDSSASDGGVTSSSSVFGALWGNPMPATEALPVPAQDLVLVSWPPPERVPLRALCPPALLEALQALPPASPATATEEGKDDGAPAADGPAKSEAEVGCGVGVGSWEDADVEECARDVCAQPGDRCSLMSTLHGRADHALAGMEKMPVEGAPVPVGDGCWERWRRGGRRCWDLVCVVS